MIKLHYYLDTRASGGADNPAPLKLVVNKRRRTAQLQTGIIITPSQWDAEAQKVKNHPRCRLINSDLSRMILNAEDFLRPRIFAGELADLDAVAIRDLLSGFFYGRTKVVQAYSVLELMTDVMNAKKPGTRTVYHSTLVSLREWRPGIDDVAADSFTRDKAEDFRLWLLERFKANTVNSRIASMRHAFNYAIERGKLEVNPFERVKMEKAEARKRDLTMSQLIRFWNAVPENEDEDVALRFFRLSFSLRAANHIDIVKNLTRAKIFNGRWSYKRTKTGQPLDVKIEPEAEELIAWYFKFGQLPRYSVINKRLKRVSDRLGLPPITTYWARHTLATEIFNLGYGVDIVAAALGHASPGHTVTMTYIDIRTEKVDKVMREILDEIKRESV